MKRLLILLMVLALPLSAIADSFKCMDVFIFAMEPTESELKQLFDNVQSLDIIEEERSLRVQLIDVIVLDGAFAAAWIIENTGEELLYIVDKMKVEGIPASGYEYSSSTGILAPGGVQYKGLAGYLSDGQIKDSDVEKHLSLRVAGLRLLGTPSNWEDIADDAFKQMDVITRDREINRLFFEEGKLIIDNNGNIMAGQGNSIYHFDETSDLPSAAQMYIQSGKLAAHSLVRIDASVEIDIAADSIPLLIDTSREEK